MVKIVMVYPESRVVWFTGMSGAGKSTLCKSVAAVLHARGVSTRILDGDDLRSGLCADLGFTLEDRRENVRRVAHAAGLIAQDGPLVLVALISPLHEGRQFARSILSLMTEVFVDAPLAVCEARDPKGLYQKARGGMIKAFTGIDSPYERPQSPDVICRTDLETVEESTTKITDVLMPGYNPLREPVECQRRRCIAVDFDGTLANYDGWTGENTLGTIRPDVVRVLRRLRYEGWKIIVHTTRSPESIRQHLLQSNVPFDDINRNLDYTNHGCKPVATVYWDDRALRYSGDAELDIESILDFHTWSGRF